MPTDEELIKRLQYAVVNSATRGYHKPSGKDEKYKHKQLTLLLDAGAKMMRGSRCNNFFKNGYCRYEDNCKFSHSEGTK